MLQYFYISLIILLLSSCSSKSEEDLLQAYHSNIPTLQTLKNTQKLHLYNKKGEIEMMFSITYLEDKNSDKKSKKNEEFIVNFNIDKEIDIKQYPFLLNQKEPMKIQHIDPKSNKLKNIPFKTSWSHYYLFTFAHTEEKKLYITLKSKAYEEAKLYFSKVPKYLFEK